MMLKSLNEPIVTIRGQKIAGVWNPTVNLTVKEALIIAAERFNGEKKTGDSVKIISLATRIYEAKEEIDLSLDEVRLLDGVIEECDIFMAIVKARVRSLLKKVSEDSKKK